MSSPKFGGLFLCAYMLSFLRESDACTFESKALTIVFFFFLNGKSKELTIVQLKFLFCSLNMQGS